MKGNRSTSWYETYYNLIDQRAADRTAGQPVQLDPYWATWDAFSITFRSSFGDRITRDQAVEKWDKLTQTAGVDTFLDNVFQLMWKTGYTGGVVDEKISRGLIPELAQDWAQVNIKPKTLWK